MTFYKSGSYISYTLALQEPEKVTITMGSGTEVKIYGDFSSDRYKCEVLLDDLNDKWSNEGCEVLKSNENYAIVNLKHLSIFQLVNDDNVCETGKGPIIIMSFILFMIIALGVVLIITHGKKKELKPLNRFLAIYPISSMFLPQSTLRKTTVMMQFFTSELLLLTLIGAFMIYFDSPSDYNTFSFDKYYINQLSRGVIAWALCQIYIILMFCLNCLVIQNSRFKFAYALAITISIIIIIGCIGGVIAMTIKYCGGWTNLWTITFLIFTLFEWTIVDVIYSFIIWLIYRKQGSVYEESQYSRNKVTFIAVAVSNQTENETDRKNMNIYTHEHEHESPEPENVSEKYVECILKNENVIETYKLGSNAEVNEVNDLENIQKFEFPNKNAKEFEIKREKDFDEEHKDENIKYMKEDKKNKLPKLTKLKKHIKNPSESDEDFEVAEFDNEKGGNRMDALENQQKHDLPGPDNIIEQFLRNDDSKNRFDTLKSDTIVQAVKFFY
ncbi:hypothetical protein SteCoe_37963 [Stentor coeruleus]|uniref:Uncharacterized protein n=1 Tax=Stentor coeruleus TaxID=5963 RepID=A0A1R2AM51_9CILI|nr:hypothetical protein SteCoe_37963 [Stentor coeruleus]